MTCMYASGGTGKSYWGGAILKLCAELISVTSNFSSSSSFIYLFIQKVPSR